MRAVRRTFFISFVVLLTAVIYLLGNPSPVQASSIRPQYLECILPHNTMLADIPQTTGIPCPPVKLQSKKSQVYVVKYGDTLAKIANQYNISISVLQLANPAITNPNLIYVDQKIRIPNAAEINQLKSQAEKRADENQRKIVASINHQGLHWIDVDLSSQKVRAYSGDTLEKTFFVSTGTVNYPTVTGQYKVWIKLRYDDMRGPGYNLKDVPYVLYFYKGYGLHGTYWHHNFGTPMSHGCVNLSIEDAAWVYDFAEVGTLVNVH